MGRVLVVASGKGGTGKTTVCTTLAATLSKSKKVLVIDTDSGMRGVDLVLGVSDYLVYDISDVISGACTAEQATMKVPYYDNLYVIEAPLKADDEISPTILKKFVDKIRDQYDYILIDSPAGTGSGFESAAMAADEAIIVVNPERSSVRGGQNIRERLTEFGIENSRLIINRFDKKRFNAINVYDDLDQIIDEVGVRLLAVIPEDVLIVSLVQGGYSKKILRLQMIFDNIVERLEGIDTQLVIKI